MLLLLLILLLFLLLLLTLPIDYNHVPRIPALKTWFRTSRAVVMHLTNGTMQINFFKVGLLVVCLFVCLFVYNQIPLGPHQDNPLSSPKCRHLYRWIEEEQNFQVRLNSVNSGAWIIWFGDVMWCIFKLRFDLLEKYGCRIELASRLSYASDKVRPPFVFRSSSII